MRTILKTAETKLQNKIMMSRESMQQKAMQLNNEAVAMMECGNYQQAIPILTDVLRKFRSLMDYYSQKGQHQEDLKISMDECMAQSQQSVTNDGQYFFYRHAIRAPLEMEHNYQAAVMCSAMVVFNLALAHHAAATASKKPAQVLLRAGKLYELAYNMAEDVNLKSNVLFALAICNNLGLVHSQLQHRKKTMECFQNLMSMIMFLTVNGPGEYCLEGFLQNAASVNFQALPAAGA